VASPRVASLGATACSAAGEHHCAHVALTFHGSAGLAAPALGCTVVAAGDAPGGLCLNACCVHVCGEGAVGCSMFVGGPGLAVREV
jgi:hypothetical protein